MRNLTILCVVTMLSLLPFQASAAEEKPAEKAEKKGLRGMGMDKMDSNSDGVVTRDEFMAGSEARFKLMDDDGDGKITRDELKKFRESLRERRKARSQPVGGAASSPTGRLPDIAPAGKPADKP